MIIKNENEIYEDYRLCPKCGAKVLPNNRFCTKCGYGMEKNENIERQNSEPSRDSFIAESELPQNSLTGDSKAGCDSQDNDKYLGKKSDCVNNNNTQNKEMTKTSKIIIAVLAVLLIAAIGEGIYLYSTVQHLHKSFNGMEAMKDAAVEEVGDLQAKLTQYDEMEKELADVKEELEETKIQLTASKNKVKQLGSTSSKNSTKANNYDQICTFLQSSDAGGSSDKYYADEKIVVLKKNSPLYKLPIHFKYNVAAQVSFTQSGYSAYCQWQPGDFETKTHLYIDPTTEGISTITFSNNVNSDRFRVMIVVTD